MGLVRGTAPCVCRACTRSPASCLNCARLWPWLLARHHVHNAATAAGAMLRCAVLSCKLQTNLGPAVARTASSSACTKAPKAPSVWGGMLPSVPQGGQTGFGAGGGGGGGGRGGPGPLVLGPSPSTLLQPAANRQCGKDPPASLANANGERLAGQLRMHVPCSPWAAGWRHRMTPLLPLLPLDASY